MMAVVAGHQPEVLAISFLVLMDTFYIYLDLVYSR